MGHISDELLEQYCLRSLSESESGALEQHLSGLPAMSGSVAGDEAVRGGNAVGGSETAPALTPHLVRFILPPVLAEPISEVRAIQSMPNLCRPQLWASSGTPLRATMAIRYGSQVEPATFSGEIAYNGFVVHIHEDDLERYAMQTLPEADLESLEEHLLICSACRERLDAETEFVSAIRSAAAQFKTSRNVATMKARGV